MTATTNRPETTPDLGPGIQTFIGTDLAVPVEYLLVVDNECVPPTRTLHWRFAGPDSGDWQKMADLGVADWPARYATQPAAGPAPVGDVVALDGYDPRVGEIPC
ncbi:hypothetical protein [Nocardioides sp.]|uniref:hypothetical protein n=1 Tax=Nocardioides sp. TaxID=35761 RepID=UPI003516708F